MITLEFINYTTDMVYYHEDLETALIELNELKEKNPNDEIGISHLEVFGVKIPATSENLECLENCTDENNLELLVKFGNHNSSIIDSLEDLQDDLENNYCTFVIYGYDKLTCFEEYCDSICVTDDIPQNLRYYFDYEKYMRDCELEGMDIIELSCGYAFIN